MSISNRSKINQQKGYHIIVNKNDFIIEEKKTIIKDNNFKRKENQYENKKTSRFT